MGLGRRRALLSGKEVEGGLIFSDVRLWACLAKAKVSRSVEIIRKQNQNGARPPLTPPNFLKGCPPVPTRNPLSTPLQPREVAES